MFCEHKQQLGSVNFSIAESKLDSLCLITSSEWYVVVQCKLYYVCDGIYLQTLQRKKL